MSGSLEIRIGLGSCGVASGGEPVHEALRKAALEAGANGIVKKVGCNGMCHREPLVEVVEPNGRATLYGNVTPDTALRIARKHVHPRRLGAWARRGARTVTELVSRGEERPRLSDFRLDRRTGPAAAYLGKQKRIVLENCGDIDPERIEDYLARDGYQALTKCLRELSPEQVIAAISESEPNRPISAEVSARL